MWFILIFRLAMYELTSFLTHIQSQGMTDELRNSGFWKYDIRLEIPFISQSFFRKFTSSNMLDPTQWSSIFTKAEVDKCLNRISSISLGETKVCTWEV